MWASTISNTERDPRWTDCPVIDFIALYSAIGIDNIPSGSFSIKLTRLVPLAVSMPSEAD